MKKFFSLFLCAIILSLHTYAWSHVNKEQRENIERLAKEKIYVSPEEIDVTKDGILFYDSETGNLRLSDTLSYDEKGLYISPITPERGPCGLHRTWCRYCGGCGVIYCPMIMYLSEWSRWI